MAKKVKESKKEVSSNDEIATKQLVESLKVTQRPTKKVITPVQRHVVEEDALDISEKMEEKMVVAATPKRTADGILSAVSSQLESLLKIDFNFANEADVFKYVSSIETSIEKIKERLL